MSNVKKHLSDYQDFTRIIREFFYTRQVTEVVTPSLLEAPTTDVYIDSIEVSVNQAISKPSKLYLHTSPELEMKRLLAKGSGDIFQMCQVYRDNEYGRINSNEFTMLEFYRIEFNIHQLMDEITELLAALGSNATVKKLSYSQVFFEYSDIDILNSDMSDLKKIANKLGLSSDYDWIEDIQMLLFVHLIEPKLKEIPVCFIYDFPNQQAALAEIHGPIAHRFEMYLSGTEVANGYQEIQSAQDYRDRFNTELNKRKDLSKPFEFLDNSFLEDLEKGIPKCSGVAIGIERLYSSLSL